MSEKKFKTLDEQIDILKSKGMIIKDSEYARKVLLKENYFFLTGYRHLFLKSSFDRTYLEGTTFEEVYSLFLFDREFRNIIFKYCLIIENNIKSVLSYQLSKKYGYKEEDYLKEKNFNTDPMKKRQVNDLIKKMRRQIRVNGDQHTATMHYKNNYGYTPFWILVKVLSFGIIGEVFAVLKEEDQQAIVETYNSEINTFIDYLPILANYRNLCAHEDIVFENRTQKQIDDNIIHSLLNIPKQNGEYSYGKNDLFALIIIMYSVLNKEEIINIVEEISGIIRHLEYNLNTISINKVLDRMGFPSNWSDIKDLRKEDEIEK